MKQFAMTGGARSYWLEPGAERAVIMIFICVLHFFQTRIFAHTFFLLMACGRFALMIVNVLVGDEAGVVYIERRDWDVKTRLLSSIEKARRLLGYEPKMEFEDGY